MINKTELEHESSEEELFIEEEQKEDFLIDSSHKSSQTKEEEFKFSGNIQKDLITVMSQKPDQFHFSFTGLRRFLGVHQQQLVNTIDRLLEDSVLHKTPDGYLLSPEYRQKIIQNDENWKNCDSWIGNRIYPAPIPLNKLYKELYGKWFGRHRFLGGIHNADFLVLDWVDMEHSGSNTRLEATSNHVKLKFKSVSGFERDKAINVFSDVFISIDSPIMIEKAKTYINN